jgi:hypothetical protein
VIVSDLVTQLSARDIQIDRPSASLNIADLNILRHELENRLAQIDEIDYANQQANCIDEILAWIEAIITKRAVRLTEAETLIIPKNEYPAYLEWVIWRAFLAINSLINRPWLARRFQIDQDFLPVSCAPGGGPDMVFEFENYIIVVEVTLTASSRQEAAEGEPVRRHVARYVETSEKSVYGLFIAVQIDSNTAHTFKSGDWYRPDDTRMTLDIVPITLRDFASLFSSARGRLESMPTILSNMLIECRARANQDAPQWKASISAIIARLAG